MRGITNAIATLVFVFVAASASAQTAAPTTNGAVSASTNTTSDESLVDVVVTATRRSERLQDVPQQVDAAGGEMLRLRHLENTTDLQYAVPALTFTAGANSGSSTFSIRGIGTAAPLPSVEQSVGLNIDGVSIGTEGAGISSLLDVNRIEVIEGPAGMLFGKNASAGLITIYTNAPVLKELSAGFHESYGKFNEVESENVVNLPVGDTAALRFAGLYHYYDGVSTNVANGEKVNGLDEFALRGRLRWEPASEWRVDLIGETAYNHSACCNNAFRVDPETPTNAIVAADEAAGEHPGPNNTNVALTPGLPITRARNYNGQLEINYDPGVFTVTSLSAYRTYNSMIYIDASFGIPAVLANRQRNELSQFSQELRLTSDEPVFNRLFDYVAGLYFFHSDVTKDQILAPISNTDTLSPVSDVSYAAFGQATIHVTDRFRLIAGGRNTHDSVRQSDLVAKPGPNATPSNAGYTLADTGEAKATNFSYRGGLQYDLVGGVMAYATVAKGYKGPAYSAIPASGGVPAHSISVLPELSTAYEVGLRAAFWNDRGTLNLTAFDQKFNNYQASIFNQTAFVTYLTNAGAAVTRGVEGSLAVKPLSGLTLTLQADFDDAHFTDFKNIPCSTGFRVNYPATCSGPGGTTNATNQTLPNAPRFASGLVVNYERALVGAYTGSITGSCNYRSQVNFEATGDPYTIQPGYGLLGANVGFGPQDGRWRVSLYGRNLADRRFATGIQAAPFLDGSAFNQTVSIDEFRTFGVHLDANL
jgi:iron complex outermembrane recepter protein